MRIAGRFVRHTRRWAREHNPRESPNLPTERSRRDKRFCYSDSVALFAFCVRVRPNHKDFGTKGLPLLPTYITLLSNLEFPNSTNEWPFLTSQPYFQDKGKDLEDSFYLTTFASPRPIQISASLLARKVTFGGAPIKYAGLRILKTPIAATIRDPSRAMKYTSRVMR